MTEWSGIPGGEGSLSSHLHRWMSSYPFLKRAFILPNTSEAPLWSTLEADKHGSRSRGLSKRWGRWMRKALKPREGLVAAHGWRHRAKPLMERAKVRAAAQDAFLGHKGPGVGWGTYYSPSEEELIEAARAMHLPKRSS